MSKVVLESRNESCVSRNMFGQLVSGDKRILFPTWHVHGGYEELVSKSGADLCVSNQIRVCTTKIVGQKSTTPKSLQASACVFLYPEPITYRLEKILVAGKQAGRGQTKLQGTASGLGRWK